MFKNLLQGREEKFSKIEPNSHILLLGKVLCETIQK